MLPKTTEEFLRKEFFAHEDEAYAEYPGFLLTLHHHAWDKAKFRALLAAMVEACLVYAGQEMLPRWLAAGFWLMTTEIQSITSQSWRAKWLEQEQAYYQKVGERISNLGNWLFWNLQPYNDIAQYLDLPE